MIEATIIKTREWDKKTSTLNSRLADAAKELIEHLGGGSIVIPIFDENQKPGWILIGSTERLKDFLENRAENYVDFEWKDD